MNAQQLAMRAGQIAIVLVLVSFITFFLTYLAPGDPATAMYTSAGLIPTEEQLRVAREAMGLDKPFLAQYFIWASNVLHGDFGTSFSQNAPVLGLLATRMPVTLCLAFLALGMTLIVSVPLGIVTAVKENTVIDHLIRAPCFVGISLPGFAIGLLLIYFVAYKMGLFPVVSHGTSLNSMILPASTLAIAMSAKYTRQVRTAVLAELQEDYVTGARARGMSETAILFKHVLPNAMLPLVTILGLSLGSLLGGAAVVEIVFAFPGLGNLAVMAVTNRDYPLIQGCVLWIALAYMVINVLVDISYRLIDPRTRRGKES